MQSEGEREKYVLNCGNNLLPISWKKQRPNNYITAQNIDLPVFKGVGPT